MVLPEGQKVAMLPQGQAAHLPPAASQQLIERPASSHSHFKCCYELDIFIPSAQKNCLKCVASFRFSKQFMMGLTKVFPVHAL